MGRHSTLPQVWLNLATAVGGVRELEKALGVSNATLFRMARNQTQITPEQADKIADLAKSKKLPSPVTKSKPRSRNLDQADLSTLDLVGKMIARGKKIPQDVIVELNRSIGSDNLVFLSEIDASEQSQSRVERGEIYISSNALRAVGTLLGL